MTDLPVARVRDLPVRAVRAAAVCVLAAAFPMAAAAVLDVGSAAEAAPAVSPPPAAPSRGSRTLTVSADELEVDARAGVATATGRVRITDGVVTVTAARATLYHREGRGLLTGQARAAGPQGVLQGEQIAVEYTPRAITRIAARGGAVLDAEGARIRADNVILLPAADTVVAEGKVSISAWSGITATGGRLVYRRPGGTAVLEARGRVEDEDGFVEANRLESLALWERLVATGDVHSVYRGVEVRSRTAEVFVREQKAVFAGEVRVAQPGRVLTADLVTVWYATGRIVAEGQTWFRLEPQP